MVQVYNNVDDKEQKQFETLMYLYKDVITNIYKHERRMDTSLSSLRSLIKNIDAMKVKNNNSMISYVLDFIKSNDLEILLDDDTVVYTGPHFEIMPNEDYYLDKSWFMINIIEIDCISCNNNPREDTIHELLRYESFMDYISPPYNILSNIRVQLYGLVEMYERTKDEVYHEHMNELLRTCKDEFIFNRNDKGINYILNKYDDRKLKLLWFEHIM